MMRATCPALAKVALAASLAAASVPAAGPALAAETSAPLADGMLAGEAGAPSAGLEAAEAAESGAAAELDAARDGADALEAPSRAAAQAEKEVAQAEAAMDAAEQARAAAQAEADSAAASLDAAKSALDAAQGAYDEASDAAGNSEEQIAKGSLGFFESCGAGEYAVSLLTYRLEKLGSPYKDYTHIGEEGDATSLPNMKLALERMAKVDDLRRAEGLDELKIIDSAMARSQVLANYSSEVYGHMGYVMNAREEFDSSENSTGISIGLNNYYAGENLAWDYDDPFTGWYDAEKAYYERTGSMPGHYKNIVSDYNHFYGCAAAQGTQGFTDEQSFGEENYFWETEYTPAEYYARFMAYYDGLMNAASAKEAAAGALAAARAEYGSAEAAKDAADAKVTSAEKSYAEAEAAREKAQQALEQALAEKEANAEALEQAKAALEQAQAAYAEAHAAASAERALYYAAHPFPDVDWSQYYADGASYAAAQGLMSGYSGGARDGYFGVGDVLTRGQLATILWRASRPGAAASYDAAAAVNETGMADVEGGKYYTAAANWAVENGVVNGFDIDGHREFRPNEPVTMEQFACIMANLTAGGADGYDASGLGARYADASSISNWALASVAYGTDEGWFGGYENADGTRELKPYEALSRERAATMLMNMGFGK